MELLKKSKRVSWAPDEYLCEVKPVLETDAPFRIGTIPSLYGPSPSYLASRFENYAKVYGDIWKEKKPKIFQSHDNRYPEMPPGFDYKHIVVDGILKWKCPPKMDMCRNWKVVAGEDSQETKAQKLRQMRELEVFYPHSSSIPYNPYISLDIENEHYDDRQTPNVPIEEIEDDDDDNSNLEKPVSTSITSHPLSLPQVQLASNASEVPSIELPGPDPVVAAYVAALTAILEAKYQGASIDIDFLVKILSNPKMIEQLSEVDGVVVSSSSESALTNAVTIPMVASMPVIEPIPITATPNLMSSLDPVPVTIEPNSYSMLQPTFESMPAQPGPYPMSPSAAMTTNPTTVMVAQYYYHNLIKEYGGNKQDMPSSSVMQPDTDHNQSQNMKQVKRSKPVASKTKYRKRCRFYFGSATGCLNGSNCLYRHDVLPKVRAGW